MRLGVAAWTCSGAKPMTTTWRRPRASRSRVSACPGPDGVMTTISPKPAVKPASARRTCSGFLCHRAAARATGAGCAGPAPAGASGQQETTPGAPHARAADHCERSPTPAHGDPRHRRLWLGTRRDLTIAVSGLLWMEAKLPADPFPAGA